MIEAFVVHLFKVAIGYLCAAFAAALVFWAILKLSFPYNYVHHGVTQAVLSDIRKMDFLTSIFSLIQILALLALPVWFITVVLGELTIMRSVRHYLVAGVLGSTPYLVMTFGEGPPTFDIWLLAIIPGAIGGLVYWAIAGRLAGMWWYENRRVKTS
jgi:hypothetical protein